MLADRRRTIPGSLEMKSNARQKINPYIVDVKDGEKAFHFASDKFRTSEPQVAKTRAKRTWSEVTLEAVWYNSVIVLALVAWAALILIELFLFPSLEGVEYWMRLGLDAFFVAELLFRLIITDWPDEWSAGNVKYYVLDAILLFAAIAVEIAKMFPDTISLRTDLIVQLSVYFARILIRLLVAYIGLTKGARRLVGGRKRRFQKDGFDLDLTYIEPQLIAMGLPSVDFEGLYRNPLREIVRFFNTRHTNKYHIYNLCEERDYPEDGFKGLVRRYGFDDHNPPPLSLLVRLCDEASGFIRKNRENIVAIHCKGGKGRTGVVTAAILLKLHSDWYAEKALLKFAVMRTDDDVKASKRVGVDGPSQRRYVEYWEKIRHLDPKLVLERLSQRGPRCKFQRLSLFNINVTHNFLAGQARGLAADSKLDEKLLGWTLMVSNYWYDLKSRKEEKKTYIFKAELSGSGFDIRRDGVSFDIKSWEKKSTKLSLTGDVRFQVYPINVGENPKVKPFCEFWVHTTFLSKSGQLVLRKTDLDQVFRNPKIDNEFNVQLSYDAPMDTWDELSIGQARTRCSSDPFDVA